MAITVKPRKNESIESLCARFKRKCKEDKLFIRIMDKEFYVKPSQKNRLKRKQRNKQNEESKNV